MKPVLNIAISRSQILRNFILSDHGKFISELQTDFKINILTAVDMKELIDSYLKQFPLIKEKIEVFEIPKLPKLNFLILVLIKISKYLMNADHIIIHIKNSSSKSIFRKMFMYFTSKIISRIPSIKFFLRKIFRFQINRLQYINNTFSNLPSCDVFFSTSLTDLLNESCTGIYYESKGIKTLGTPRSWDNITSYGCILWFPKLILSHSKYMTQNLIEFQEIDVENILEITAPNYRKRFSPEQNHSSNLGRVGFACMGFTTNPDDLNIFKWIVSDLAYKFPNITFVVFQHPKFQYHIDFYVPKNVLVRTFLYESSTLNEYYTELASLNVMFAGGTSVLLDSEFCRVKTYFINFEIKNQNFWNSALRYRDMWPHTRDFLKLNEVEFVNSELEMITIINGIDLGKKLDYVEKIAEKFMGDDKKDFTNLLKSTIKKLL